MQTADALARVAAECAEDLAADGVVYAEVRYAPELHVGGDLSLPEVVEAVNAGFREGERRAAAAGKPIRIGALLTAMRHAARSREIAELAVQYRDDGVVGFDIAGAEAGSPAHAPPRRVRVPPAGERPLHDPRGRGVRPAVDLAGDPVVRRRPARPRRAHHRRRDGRDRPARPRWAGSPPTCATSASRWRCAPRPTCMTGAASRSRTIRSGCSARSLPRDGQHRQPADEPHVDDQGVQPARRCVRLRPARLPVVHRQRHEVGRSSRSTSGWR